MATAGTFYPIVSLRLKASELDAIVILNAISLMAAGGTANYVWQILSSATTSGGSWQSAGANSGVEYNISGTSTSGGSVLAQGYFSASNQSTSAVDILKEALFTFQLERNGLTNTPYELSLVASASTNTSTLHAAVNWQEISR